MFRYEEKPMWEQFPTGGTWILRLPVDSSSTSIQHVVNKLYEDLLIAAVTEYFGDGHVVGVGVSMRKGVDMLCVWLSNNQQELRFAVGEKLKALFHLEQGSVLEYKQNIKSIQQHSTFSNTQPWVFQ